MSRRWARARGILAGGAAILTFAMALGAVLLAALNLRDGWSFDSNAGQMLGELTLGSSYAAVGWLIASRRGDNPLGWVYLGIGLSQVGESFVALASYRGMVLSPGSVPGAELLAWVGTFGWAPGYVLLLSFSLLLFPTGHLPSPRWRPVAWLAVLSLVLMALPVAIAGLSMRASEILFGSPPDWVNALQLVGLLALLVVGAASAISLIVRWRRSSGLERQQLKWFAAAMVPVLLVLALSAFVTYPPVLWVVVALVIAPLLPLSVGLAVLRYRLYEIDRVISRTIGWAAVSGILVAVFATAVVGLQALLAGFTQGQTLAVAASTLLAAAAFQPVRRRVQRAVDRRFDRARYDGERIAALFGSRLRDEVDLPALEADVAQTVESVLRPSSTTVWIRRTG